MARQDKKTAQQLRVERDEAEKAQDHARVAEIDEQLAEMEGQTGRHAQTDL